MTDKIDEHEEKTEEIVEDITIDEVTEIEIKEYKPAPRPSFIMALDEIKKEMTEIEKAPQIIQKELEVEIINEPQIQTEPEINIEKKIYEQLPGATIEIDEGIDQVVMNGVEPTALTISEYDAMSYLPALTEEDEITLDGWKKRVVIITGASSGIGLATARKFCLYADTVYNLSPERQDDDNINFIKTDVTKPTEVRDAIKKIYDKEGQIDVLINNAGIGFTGSAEGADHDTMTAVFHTNVLGMATCTAEVIPHMRERGRGRIINISSLAGVFPLPFQSLYSASKSAIITYTNSIATEIKPFNIKVTCVLFAEVKSNFTENRLNNKEDDISYKYRLGKSKGKYEYAEQNGRSPDWVAKKLFRLSNKKNPRPVVVFGCKNKFAYFFKRFLSQRAINRLIARKY
ncbi:MAG: SDR family NAD(P)-dependent oxidoreductase [Firmicutes bacterium]|nr:SDR family NAD(P)-dependent oxidoreductase [Bacillota bacterium]